MDFDGASFVFVVVIGGWLRTFARPIESGVAC